MFRKRMSDALREAREYRDPTCPICEGEGCQCPQGEETINEGFASDAQRRAAFASGYKEKGKKKKEEIEEKFTSAQIKQAYGILNDPRYRQGNYSGAVSVINKIAPGLADHPDVKNALRRANEEIVVVDETELEEGMMKRVMQTVHDKLAKEGGAAGYDDLKKEVKKEHDIDISKDSLKNMPGVKQHRDGDYILEEVELNEFSAAQLAALRKAYMPLKGKTLSMDQINRLKNMLSKLSKDQLVKLANTDIPFVATGATSMAVMNKGMKWSDFRKPMDMGEALELQCEACWSGYKQVGLKKKGDKMVPNCVPEEVHLELFGEADLSKSQVKMVHKKADDLPKKDFKDRYGKDGDSVRYATATNMVKKKLGISEFTKRDYKELEKINDHDGAAKGVVDMHGTSAEKMKIDAIIARNNMRGHITKADQTKRDDIVRKYYNKLKENLNTGKNDIRGSFTNAQLSRMKQTWATKSINDLTKSVKDYVMKLDKPTQAAIIAAKINHLSNYVDKNFDMKESKVIGEETMAEMSYKDKFAAALKDAGKSLADMSDDEKKKFFNKVDSMHGAKNEAHTPGHDADEKNEMYEMMKKEMMKKMEMMKAETDPAKLDMMKKEMMKEMGKMPEMMKKEMMKKMNAAYNMNMEEAEPMTRDTMSLSDKAKDKKEMMKMNAMKMPIRAMYKNMDMDKKDEMKKMNAMKKMEELTPAQKKLPAGLQKAIAAKQDKKDDKQEMMKKKMKEKKYHMTKEGSLEDAVYSALTFSQKG